MRLLFVALLPFLALSASFTVPSLASPAANLSIRLAHTKVRPGHPQVATVSAAPDQPVEIAVIFPNGAGKCHKGVTGSNGRLAWTFIQPPNTIRPGQALAFVSVGRPGTGATCDPVGGGSKSYTVGFGPLDLSVDPAQPWWIDRIRLLAHSRPRTQVHLTVHFGDGSSRNETVRTGRAGWGRSLPLSVSIPQGGKARLTGSVVLSGRRVNSHTTFVIRVPTTSIESVQLLHQVSGQWEPTTTVRLGEDVRFVAHYVGMEPAGLWVPPCSAGMGITLRVAKGDVTILSTPLQCSESMSDGIVYADTRFVDPADVGQLTAAFSIGETPQSRKTMVLRFSIVLGSSL